MTLTTRILEIKMYYLSPLKTNITYTIFILICIINWFSYKRICRTDIVYKWCILYIHQYKYSPLASNCTVYLHLHFSQDRREIENNECKWTIYCIQYMKIWDRMYHAQYSWNKLPSENIHNNHLFLVLCAWGNFHMNVRCEERTV